MRIPAATLLKSADNIYLLRIRTRRFRGRCARHKRYNPAVDGRGGIKANCGRCDLLAEIYETSLRLNALVRRFDPKHDDVQRPKRPTLKPDPRQMSLLDPPEDGSETGKRGPR
jgi:hypothetical protein